MNTKEQTRRLWKTCFDDDDAFVDLYFNMRYQEEINQVIEEDGKVVAALQMIPYPMTFCGHDIPMSYISGACTLPDYRNRGIMRRLLYQTHRAMYNQGVLVASLIPAEEWLKAYYGRSGYAVCFNYSTKVINSYEQSVNNYNTNLFISKLDLLKKVSSEVYTFFNEQMNERPCCVQHTIEDMEIVLADLRLSGGDLWTIHEGGLLTGMVFCVPQKDMLSVKEMLLSDAEDETPAILHILTQYKLKKAELFVPSSDADHPLGMARLIDVPACLELFAQSDSGKHIDLYIEVIDDEAIPSNNGFYHLCNGKVERGYQEGPDFRVFTIRELTTWIMKDLHPYMSLMLN